MIKEVEKKKKKVMRAFLSERLLEREWKLKNENEYMWVLVCGCNFQWVSGEIFSSFCYN